MGLSLVDPDNRRPVDYDLRERLLTELDRKAEAGNLPALCAELLENYQDGRIKLWTTMQALRLRRDRRDFSIPAITSRCSHWSEAAACSGLRA